MAKTGITDCSNMHDKVIHQTERCKIVIEKKNLSGRITTSHHFFQSTSFAGDRSRQFSDTAALTNRAVEADSSPG